MIITKTEYQLESSVSRSPEDMIELRSSYQDVDQVFSDVTISTGSGSFIKAHKSLLSHISPVLRDIWLSNPFTTIDSSVIIPGVSVDLVNVFLSLINTGKASFDPKDLDELTALMISLGVDDNWILSEVASPPPLESPLKKRKLVPGPSVSMPGPKSKKRPKLSVSSLLEPKTTTPIKDRSTQSMTDSPRISITSTGTIHNGRYSSSTGSEVEMNLEEWANQNQTTETTNFETCALCQSNDKIDFANQFASSAFHYSLCYLKDYKKRNVALPSAFNYLGKPLKSDDIKKSQQTFTCAICQDITDVSFKRFFIHNAVVHGLLAEVIAQDYRPHKFGLLDQFLDARAKIASGDHRCQVNGCYFTSKESNDILKHMALTHLRSYFTKSDANGKIRIKMADANSNAGLKCKPCSKDSETQVKIEGNEDNAIVHYAIEHKKLLKLSNKDTEDIDSDTLNALRSMFVHVKTDPEHNEG